MVPLLYAYSEDGTVGSSPEALWGLLWKSEAFTIPPGNSIVIHSLIQTFQRVYHGPGLRPHEKVVREVQVGWYCEKVTQGQEEATPLCFPCHMRGNSSQWCFWYLSGQKKATIWCASLKPGSTGGSALFPSSFGPIRLLQEHTPSLLSGLSVLQREVPLKVTDTKPGKRNPYSLVRKVTF